MTTVEAISRPLEIVSIREIAELFGVRPNTAWRWSKMEDFPEPAVRLAVGPIWRRADVERWARRTGRGLPS